ncbi:MAG TPA: hypothetical protein DEB23_03145 [Chitinophagaceae bacterium]|nr:hypothetical protein [Chitinophagaceae bacterium]
MNIYRTNTFGNDIILIDGFWGTGKSLISRIIAHLKGVENPKIEEIYEYISSIFYLNKIDEDAGSWLIKTYADRSQYNNLIGREINLRWRDDTGLKNRVNKIETITRLFTQDGDIVVDEINTQNIAFSVMTHKLMLSPNLVFKSFGSRLKFIEILRHPIFIVEHYITYLLNFNSLREFTISGYDEGEKIPWFCNSWKDEYCSLNETERSALIISRGYNYIFSEISKLRQENILIVPFEELAFNTEVILDKIQIFTNRKFDSGVFKTLKKINLPRDSDANNIDEKEYHRIFHKVKRECNQSVFNEFLNIINHYNNLYPNKYSFL